MFIFCIPGVNFKCTFKSVFYIVGDGALIGGKGDGKACVREYPLRGVDIEGETVAILCKVGRCIDTFTSGGEEMHANITTDRGVGGLCLRGK